MIVDKSRVKFVNGKFILSTNDKSNPVQLVRQKESGNDHDVVIHLSDGSQFDDRIENFKNLVDLTTNKLFGFKYTIHANASKYAAHHQDIELNGDEFADARQELVDNELDKFNQSIIKLIFDTPRVYEIFSSDDTIVKPSERVWYQHVDVNLKKFTMPRVAESKYGGVNFEHVWSDITVSFFCVVLCPLEHIDEIRELVHDLVYEELCRSRRSYPARICDIDVSTSYPTFETRTVNDFFTQNLSSTSVSINVTTNDKKTFMKRFTSNEELDIMSLFDGNVE